MVKRILAYLISLIIGAICSSGFATGFKFKVSVIDGATNEPAKMVCVDIYEYLNYNKYTSRQNPVTQYGRAYNFEGGTVECELESRPNKKIRVNVAIIEEDDDGVIIYFRRVRNYPSEQIIMTIPEDSVESYTHPTITISPKKTD